MLPSLIQFHRARCAPAPDEQLLAALTASLALCGGPMTQDDRTAWQLAAADELEAIPAALALESLQRARRKCKNASEIIPFVFEDVGSLAERQRAALDGLIRLHNALTN